ncbi:hypothetical protein NIES4072_59060 [Nostoc commune NIES-4072]|uniref:Uncharacterized protein n=1 Tax=Nostoc commune NIES-4072 TaxID=2005467 RepID=A0A2R5FXL3_NOSCO|nr:hypothetical protein NIES4070_31870 [Nostoc commune HK-02]GBG22198.1 hypothetical protein NIES4072_59060 [Nostoc commune NIES-4072]
MELMTNTITLTLVIYGIDDEHYHYPNVNDENAAWVIYISYLIESSYLLYKLFFT